MPPMNEQLIKRCSLAMLVSMTLALAMGLQVWGPIQLQAELHRYADQRSWHGLPQALNALSNFPLLLASAWGWRSTAASRWPAHLRAAWRGFHGFMLLSSVLGLAYHLRPNDGLFVATHLAVVGAFGLLTCALLAERLGSAFASRTVRLLVPGVATALGVGLLIGERFSGSIDMRPVMLLEVVPMLLLPSGLLQLPGAQTRALDWFVLLAGYGMSEVFALFDAPIFRATGWISGHTLMHLSLAFAAGWMAYRAAAAAGAGVEGAGAGSSQRSTSLNTSVADAM